MRAPWFCLLLFLGAAPSAAQATCPETLDHRLRMLRSSEQIHLCERFAGRPLLIVNTASHCGFTPQFRGLEALHRRYGGRGLGVLGVPSDSFRQAAKDEAEAAQVCYVNYGVTFTMLAELEVVGARAHPLFAALAREAGPPSWNFNKYLLDADGRVVARFDSTVEPMSEELTSAVERVLDASAGNGDGRRLADVGSAGVAPRPAGTRYVP